MNLKSLVFSILICILFKITNGIQLIQAHFCCNRNPPCFVTPEECFQGIMGRSIILNNLRSNKIN